MHNECRQSNIKRHEGAEDKEEFVRLPLVKELKQL